MATIPWPLASAWARLAPVRICRCSMPTGQIDSQAPQLVHWPSASSEITLPTTAGVVGELHHRPAPGEHEAARVERLAGAVGRALLGAALALDAGQEVEPHLPRRVLHRLEAERRAVGPQRLLGEVERQDLGHALGLEVDGRRREDEMEVLAAQDLVREDQDDRRVQPPVGLGQQGRRGDAVEVGEHQQDDHRRHDRRAHRRRVGRDLLHREAAEGEAEDRRR